MLIEPDYRGDRIEVYAEPVDDRWDATVRIWRIETRAAIWARRWVDLHAERTMGNGH